MFTAVGPFTLQTYMLYLSLAIAVSGGVAYFRLRGHMSGQPVGDVSAAMVAGGFVLARAEYALLNWDVFAGQPSRVFDMRTGGLDWHGAVIGAVAGLWLVAHLRGLDARLLLDASAPALPLVAFAGWTACRAVGCVYGAEVATLAYHPAWVVTEGRDIYGIIAPRYDTHTFGQALSWALLVLVGGLWLRDWLLRWRAALVIALFAAGMLAIGVVRGDYAPLWAGVRADAWLDGLIIVLALWVAVRSR